MSIQELNKMRVDHTCPDCGGEVLHKTSESYCRKCGLVVDDFPFDDEENAFDGEGNLLDKRVGPPLKPGISVPSSIF